MSRGLARHSCLALRMGRSGTRQGDQLASGIERAMGCQAGCPAAASGCRRLHLWRRRGAPARLPPLPPPQQRQQRQAAAAAPTHAPARPTCGRMMDAMLSSSRPVPVFSGSAASAASEEKMVSVELSATPAALMPTSAWVGGCSMCCSLLLCFGLWKARSGQGGQSAGQGAGQGEQSAGQGAGQGGRRSSACRQRARSAGSVGSSACGGNTTQRALSPLKVGLGELSVSLVLTGTCRRRQQSACGGWMPGLRPRSARYSASHQAVAATCLRARPTSQPASQPARWPGRLTAMYSSRGGCSSRVGLSIGQIGGAARAAAAAE